MTTLGYEEISNAAYLMAGQNPNWDDEVIYTEGASLPGPPGDIALGTDTAEAIVSLMRIQLREKPGYQRAWIDVNTVTNVLLYRITIDSVNYDYTSDASATEQEILTGLILAHDAGSPPTTISQVQIGGVDTLLLEASTAGTTYILATSTELDQDIEATSVTFDVWLIGRNKTIFDQAEGFIATTITDNWTQRIELSGYDRMFLEPTAKDGRLIVELGPCLLQPEV